MEITIKGTEKELQAASGMINHQMLVGMLKSNNFPDGIVLQMGMHNPGKLVTPPANGGTPRVSITGVDEAYAATKAQETTFRQLYEELGPGVQGYVHCLNNYPSADGKTEAEIKRCLQKKNLGQARRSLADAAYRFDIPVTDLISETEKRKRKRFALTPTFGRIVTEIAKELELTERVT